MCQERAKRSARVRFGIRTRERGPWLIAVLATPLFAGVAACGGDSLSVAERQREDVSAGSSPCYTSTSGVTCVDGGITLDGGVASPETAARGPWWAKTAEGHLPRSTAEGAPSPETVAGTAAGPTLRAG
jgi:hypothetical protein